jgi:site-specific recombinase XerD
MSAKRPVYKPKKSVKQPGSASKCLNLQMAERFRAWLGAQKYAESTQDRYFKIAAKLCRFIGNKPLSAVTPMDIGDFLTQPLPDRWADSYIADHLGPLRSFFDFLYLGGVVDSVAPRFLKFRARLKPLPSALTQSQVRKLIRTAKQPRDRALIELLYATGCRIGEIRLARVEDVDFKGRRFRVRGKRKERMVYFGAEAAESLHLYLKGRKSGSCSKIRFRSRRGISPIPKGPGSATGRTIGLARRGANGTANGLGVHQLFRPRKPGSGSAVTLGANTLT